MAMQFLKKLPIPKEIKEAFPLTSELLQIKAERDMEIKKIFEGVSNKFVIIVGPCSADREKSLIEYVMLLSKLQDKVKEKIIIIPRVYTNKPRSLGVGYKGMLHQPVPSQEEDIFQGIISVRKLHQELIKESGLTSADEMLYPDNYRYLSDLLSYVTIGARSVENQEHKFVASGLDIPVGMKNPISGNFSILLNSISAAHSNQRFIYRGWEVKTSGNFYTHAILRGGINCDNTNTPNYYFEKLKELCYLYQKANCSNPSVIVDVNHSNSGKDYLEQIRISMDVMNSRSYSTDIKQFVKGIMIESYLEDGCQSINEVQYGKSITDPCLGWDKTERLILELAGKI